MDSLERYCALSGLRIQILAGSLACRTEFARGLHRRLAARLQPVIAATLCEITGDADCDPSAEIHLLDTLVVDPGTHEYRLNGGSWRSCLDGDTPDLVPDSDPETEGLSRFVDELAPFGVPVTIHRVDFAVEPVS